MSSQFPSIPPAKTPPVVAVPSDTSLWERISTWASDNKTVVYTIAGVAVVVTGAGVIYYVNGSKSDAAPRLSKKERRKRKEAERKAEAAEKGQSTFQDAGSSKSAIGSGTTPATAVSVSDDDDLLQDLDEAALESLSPEERVTRASKLKEVGNKAYQAKDFPKAISLYTKAILCKPESVYYSNRAACYSAQHDWDKVIEDTTAAINLNPDYVKALNRRAAAYEHLDKYSESLLDYTASCIIDGFSNDSSAQAVERLLKKFAESKAKEIMATKEARLPSPTFIGNYMQSFRAKPRPAGLEDSVELEEETGLDQLRLGLAELEKKTGGRYEVAAAAFDRAMELGDLGEHTALAYNMRGTFKCLRGKHEEALEDLSKAVEIDPTMTQAYIKRASMFLELGKTSEAQADFAKALEQNPDDPDIFYHRAQLHFIQGEFPEAAKDYQKSIDLDRDFIFSHIQLGVTQYKMGSIASSMATFRRCVKNFEGVPEVYNYFGELLMDQNRFEDAVEKFDTAIQLEKSTRPTDMNVLPLINKAVALFHWKQDFTEAEKLCEKALIIDPECDIAIATMAQFQLQQGKVVEALKQFDKAADLARTEGELVNALSYAEAARIQIQVQEKYPKLAARMEKMGPAGMPGR